MVNRLIPAIRAVAESGIGVLLIEQFATVALGLANHAHIMEGGQLRFSGLARELREKPELLRSAYLLRGSNSAPRRNVPGSGVPAASSSASAAPAVPARQDRAAPPQESAGPPGDSAAGDRPTRGAG